MWSSSPVTLDGRKGRDRLQLLEPSRTGHAGQNLPLVSVLPHENLYITYGTTGC